LQKLKLSTIYIRARLSQMGFAPIDTLESKLSDTQMQVIHLYSYDRFEALPLTPCL
jgi:hypothetical protein